MTKQNTQPVIARVVQPPYHGWAWRGAVLASAEISVYQRWKWTKHFGEGRAFLSPERDYPVLFRIYAHAASISLESPQEIVFPEETIFRIHEVCSLPDRRICIFMEQVVEPSKRILGLSDTFKNWLSGIADGLPEPEQGSDRTVREPYARWGSGALEWDSPLTGIVWEFEHAVHHVVANTDLAESVVRQVLAAQQEYQVLSGGENPSEDADEIRERAAMRHLFPEHMPVIDSCQEMSYLGRVTGQDRDTIELILEEEQAYCKDIGAIPDTSEEGSSATADESTFNPWKEAWNPWAHIPPLQEGIVNSFRLFATVHESQDGKRHMVPRLQVDGVDLCDFSSYALDLACLAGSIEKDGRFQIITCWCGESACAVLQYGVRVLHRDNLVDWSIPEPGQPRRYLFSTEEIRQQMKRLLKALTQHMVRDPTRKYPLVPWGSERYIIML